MREELLRILDTFTVNDVKDATNQFTNKDINLRTVKCCEVLHLAFQKKFNPFFAYLQTTEKTNKKDTDVEVKDDIVTIKSKMSTQDSLAIKLRNVLNNYLDNYTAGQFQLESRRLDLSALEKLCASMLSSQSNPNVVIKLVQIFDLTDDEISFKIKDFTKGNK